METATTKDDKAIEPGDDRVQFQHLSWLHLRTGDVLRKASLHYYWDMTQALRAVIPTMRWATEKVLDAVFFPVEWTGAGRVSTVMFSPQEWADAEIRELFGEVDRNAARWRAQSLLNLANLMQAQVEIQEADCSRQWYAAGRKLFAERAHGAPALHQALAGRVGLSLYSQRPMNTGYMTEVDQAFVEGRYGRGGLSASSVAEINEALDAVEAVLTADHPDEKEHDHGLQV